MLFGIIWSAFLKEKNKKNEIEKSPIVSEKIHFFEEKCRKNVIRATNKPKFFCFLALDYNEMFRKEIEHKKTKILQKTK